MWRIAPQSRQAAGRTVVCAAALYAMLAVWGRSETAAGAQTCFGRAAMIVRGSGNDTIQGTAASDVIVAGGETVAAGDGVDYVCGEGGDDTIDTGRGDDFLDGGNGSDQLHGYNGGDKIIGGTGRDFLDGRRGELGDVLIGGRGRDRMIGGQRSVGGGGNDRINGTGYVNDSHEDVLEGDPDATTSRATTAGAAAT